MHLILKIKFVKFFKHLGSVASCQLPVLLLVIYTFIPNIYKPMINIIISVKGLQKISDRLYILLYSNVGSMGLYMHVEIILNMTLSR